MSQDIHRPNPGKLYTRVTVNHPGTGIGDPFETRIIYLGNGPGFGSGRHPTTRSCLKCLERLLPRFTPANVLDAGTGSAVLAMAAVFLGAEKVTAVEIQPEVVETAKRNILLNGLQDRIRLCAGDAAALRGRYDLIIVNLNPADLLRLAAVLGRRLSAGGYMILSGLAEFARDKAFYRFVKPDCMMLCRELWDAGWSTLLLQKN